MDTEAHPYQDSKPRYTKEQVENIPPKEEYRQKKTIFRTYQIIWYILGVVEFILFLRVFLRMIGADLSGFTALVYLLSLPFAWPFLGTVPPTVVEDKIIEWSSFIAMLVYPIVAYGLTKFMQFIKPTEPEEVEEKVENV